MVTTKLREMAGPIMWVVIIAFIATIFVSWGMGGFEQRANSAGSVGGQNIDLITFDRMVQQERYRISQTYDESQIPPHQLRMIPQQVWEQQVSQIILDRAIDELQLGATAEEVYVWLKNNPPPGVDTASFFMTDGVFDTSKYIQFLNTPSSYDNPAMRQMEAYTAQVLVPMEKLEHLLKAGIVPTRAEVARQYREEYSRAVIEYALVRFSAIAVDSSVVTNDEIQRFYAANPDSFRSAEQAELYFIRIPKAAGPRDEGIYREEVEALRDRLVNGAADFAEEARMESDDRGSAEKGGDLGWFGRGTMVPEFEEVAFSLAVGEVSKPVRTQFGFHIIKLEGSRSVDGKDEIHARHILRRVSATVETIDSLEQFADSLLDLARKNDLRTAARGFDGIVFDSTGLFTRDGMVYNPGHVSGMHRFAFDNQPGALVENVFVNDPDAIHIFEVKRRLPAGVMPLDDVRTSIVQKLIRREQRARARALLEQALATGQELAELSSFDTTIVSGVTDTVSLGSYIPPLGYRNEVTAAALSVPQGERSAPVGFADGFAVVLPRWKRSVEDIPWGSPEVERIRERLVSGERSEVYQQWYLAYRERVGVTSHLDRYYLE